MPFDPNTAVLEETQTKGFNFDPSTAVLEKPSVGDILQQRQDNEVRQAKLQYEADHPYQTGYNKTLQEFSREMATVPAHFFNQFGQNSLRSIARTDIERNPFLKEDPILSFAANPESNSANPVASGITNVLSKSAGVAGGVVGLGPKLVLGMANVGAKVFPRVILPAAKALEGNIGQRMVTGAISGAVGSAAYAPDTLDENKYRQQIALGAALGALLPEPLRFAGTRITSALRTPAEKMSAIISRNAEKYRQILRPTQGELQSLEIKSGKNIDDYYKLAAEEGLVIKETKDKKLDTSDALAKLQDRKLELNEQLNSALASDPTPKFSLAEIGYKATQELRSKIKNDTEFNAAKEDVFKYIGDAIEARGNNLNGEQLNNFKQGMWSVSYDPLKPNSNKVARQIGFTAKEAIENAYPDQAIKETNRRLGDYLTLETLLQKASGRVVQGGRLGGYVASAIGAITGSQFPIVGPIGGAVIGRKVSDILNNPELRTRAMTPRPIRPMPGAGRIRSYLDAGKRYVEDTAAQGENLIRRARVGLTVEDVSGKDNPLNFQTPEEFVADKGETIYHGTDKRFNKFDLSKSADGSIWFTNNKSKIEKGEVSASGKGQIMERIIDENNLKLGGWKEADKFSTDELLSQGYDGLKLVDGEETTYQIFNPEKLKTKAQLIDEWKVAHQKNNRHLANKQ